MSKILFNDTLGMTVEEVMQLDEIELKKLLTVNVITPNGENVELCYVPIDRDYYLYPISQNGNYTFKATNSKGRSSEITVPVEIDETKIKTCAIDVYDFDSENDEYKKIETQIITFMEGQTWEEFISDLGGKKINRMVFNASDCVEIKYEKVSSLFMKLGIDGNAALPTDNIIADGVYGLTPIPQ